ncbi:MAG: ammonium transporter [Sulfurifustaceae bacterium]
MPAISFAADQPASPAPAASTPAASTAPAPAAPAAPAMKVDKGDTAWMMISTILVLLMTVPGLALFYGGLVRSKNALSTLMHVFAVFCLIGVLWVVYGYSLAFSAGGSMNSFIGGLDKVFFKGITPDSMSETFTKGVAIPELVFAMFQLTFAAITTCLIAGSYAERIKFSAVLVFSALWFTFSYAPIAHMVWFWGGPSAFKDPSGFLFAKGAIDFAGGTVVHINSGIAGLMAALALGKRVGYPRTPMPPHSLTLTMIGACLLWTGWFGFNAGSNLEAAGGAVVALDNTMFATMVAALAWMFVEWLFRGKPSMLGAASGAVAGLVAITPASGFVGVGGALVIGLGAGVVCFWAVTWLKGKLGYDDALDAFGIHCVGGILGAILTGVFVDPALGGTGIFDYEKNAVGAFDLTGQVISQLWAVGTTLVWSGVVAFVLFKLIDLTIGLRPSEDAEREGLDITEHGETAYNV